MSDVAFVVLTIALFCVLALVLRGVERLWARRTWSASCCPADCWSSWSSPCSSRSAS